MQWISKHLAQPDRNNFYSQVLWSVFCVLSPLFSLLLLKNMATCEEQERSECELCSETLTAVVVYGTSEMVAVCECSNIQLRSVLLISSEGSVDQAILVGCHTKGWTSLHTHTHTDTFMHTHSIAPTSILPGAEANTVVGRRCTHLLTHTTFNRLDQLKQAQGC